MRKYNRNWLHHSASAWYRCRLAAACTIAGAAPRPAAAGRFAPGQPRHAGRRRRLPAVQRQPLVQGARQVGRRAAAEVVACRRATSRNTGRSRAMIGMPCWAASISGRPKPSPSDGASSAGGCLVQLAAASRRTRRAARTGAVRFSGCARMRSASSSTIQPCLPTMTRLTSTPCCHSSSKAASAWALALARLDRADHQEARARRHAASTSSAFGGRPKLGALASMSAPRWK